MMFKHSLRLLHKTVATIHIISQLQSNVTKKEQKTSYEYDK